MGTFDKGPGFSTACSYKLPNLIPINAPQQRLNRHEASQSQGSEKNLLASTRIRKFGEAGLNCCCSAPCCNPVPRSHESCSLVSTRPLCLLLHAGSSCVPRTPLSSTHCWGRCALSSPWKVVPSWAPGIYIAIVLHQLFEGPGDLPSPTVWTVEVVFKAVVDNRGLILPGKASDILPLWSWLQLCSA